MILAAFVLGLSGSFHCVGMCGPLMFALPHDREKPLKMLINKILYHISRSFGYGVIGILVGFIGSFVDVFKMTRWLSIGLGIAIILGFLVSYFYNKPKEKESFISKMIKPAMTKLMRKDSFSSNLGLGFLNAFLPCGFVYLALAGALVTGSVFDSMIYMIAFGLGTAPIMIFTSLGVTKISPSFRQRIGKLTPVFTIGFALIFIMRGLSLGIPFLSPTEKMVKKMNAKGEKMQTEKKMEKIITKKD
jgi:sulfite exporter TauE/SafE